VEGACRIRMSRGIRRHAALVPAAALLAALSVRGSALRMLLLTPLVLVLGTGTALAHVRPQTTNPPAGARLDGSPAHLVLNYDGEVVPSGSSIVVLDATGAPVATQNDPVPNSRMASVSPTTDLAPGPYTVSWSTLDPVDGHTAQGFYSFVVNGGPVGIVSGSAQSEAPAADLRVTLTVTAAPDGGSLLRVDLNTTAGVERVRIRLSRPDLGEDLLDTQPSGDGAWILANNEVALPGAWHAVAVVRRTGIFDDAQATFDFNVDAMSGMPSFTTAASANA
jgi:methionine-rich copper-binding protein CopC